MDLEYVPITSHEYFEYFTDEEIPVPENDLIQIKSLSKLSSTDFWHENISTNNDHPMRLDDSDWFANLSLEPLCQWQVDWKKNAFSRIEILLTDIVNWEKNTIVHMCWHRSTVIETYWQTFTRYWINFLFEDEGPILIAKDKNELFTFGPSDNIFYAIRKNS